MPNMRNEQTRKEKTFGQTFADKSQEKFQKSFSSENEDFYFLAYRKKTGREMENPPRSNRVSFS